MRYRRRVVLMSATAAVLVCSFGVLAAQAQSCCGSADVTPFRQEPASGETIVVTDVAPHWTPFGSVVVVGFVTNLNAEPVTDVQVTASLIGREREDIATTRAELVPRILPPGGRAPWRVEIPRAPWQQGARASGTALPLDPETATTPAPALHVDDASVQENTAGYTSRFIGRMRNAGPDKVTNVRVLVALIAVDGRPAAVDEARPAVDELQPGQSVPFEVAFRLGTLPKIGAFAVYPEGTVRP
jgi:hypothetical protein